MANPDTSGTATSPVGAPRVRFAPSPTGYFHVGGARTALYNWIFARQQGGTFILRIEDTDRERSDESWTGGILAALEWLGISWEEGPYRQSERGGAYRAAVGQLLAGGHLYACECTREQVGVRTEGKIPGYDSFCRDRGLEPGPGRALRFRVPDDGVTVVSDVVRGEVEFAHANLEDFVVVKSSGDPLFVLANVVDDRDMAVSHVIRGEEHLPTTPKAVLLWRALGEAPPLPVFAHLPTLVNEKRQKLSKRRDRVAVEDYRALGYLPEAMVNYLGLLGWAPADGRELLSVDDLLAEFRLEDVNKSPAFFDEARLTHFNGLYLRALAPDDFVARCGAFLAPPLAPWPAECFDPVRFERLAPLVQERVARFGEVAGMVEYLFARPFEPDEADFAKVVLGDEQAPEILERVHAGFSLLAADGFEAAALRAVIESVAEETGRKLAKAQGPVRVATMGRRVGLPLFESLEVLGRDATVERLAAGRRRAVSAPL